MEDAVRPNAAAGIQVFVMAGGKKLPQIDVLTMAYNVVQQGVSGVDMGRNISSPTRRPR